MIKQRVIAMLPRIFAIVAVVVILGAALGAGPALAAKGGIKGKPDGNGNGHGPKNGGSAATLVLAPNPAACCGEVFSGSGSGYFPSSFAYVNIHTPKSLYAQSVATDASGNVYFEHPTAEPGTYTVQVFQYKHKKLVLMAQADLVVTE